MQLPQTGANPVNPGGQYPSTIPMHGAIFEGVQVPKLRLKTDGNMQVPAFIINCPFEHKWKLVHIGSVGFAIC